MMHGGVTAQLYRLHLDARERARSTFRPSGRASATHGKLRAFANF